MTGPASWTHNGYAQRLVFGAGVVEQVGEVCRELGMTRVLVVTTEGRRSSRDGERLLALLRASLESVSVFAGVRRHVPREAVDAAVQQGLEAGADGVVSFGGGSCADLGKAVCHVAEQRGEALLHVAVPTTYSGAELTPFYGMTEGRKKSGGFTPALAPRAAVYDPLLTLDTPPRVSAETGMNALAHGVECAYSPRRSPEAEAVALACIERVAGALPAVVASPGDIEARTAVLAGAALGGRCLQNATMGVHHGLSQQMGGHTGLPHGLVNGLILPHAIAFNQEAIGSAAGRIGAALGDAADPAGAAARLRDRVGLPATLAECGVTEEDVEVVARRAPQNGNVANNVRPVSVDDARAILMAALRGG